MATLPLAQFPSIRPVDYTSVDNALANVAKTNAINRDIEVRQDAGARIAAGDTVGAENELFKAGYLDQGLGLRNTVATQKRNAAQDQALLVNRAGGLAQIGMRETDPARKSAILKRILALDPKMQDSIASDGIDLSNPDTVFQHVSSEAAGYKGYQDPNEQEAQKLGLEKDRASIGLIHAQTAAANRKGDNDYVQRAAAAQAYGIDPNSDAGRAYILTGKLPREDQGPLTATDKKAILEADDKVATNQNAINALEEAQKISPNAYEGVTAKSRAFIGNNLPDWLVPDFIASPEKSAATSNLDNAVIGSALTQLKSIFGGNPTEGERNILLQLQGSASQPKEVRKQILDRALALGKARLDMNMRESQQLRGGTYYKPGGGMTGGVTAPSAAVTGPGNPSAAEDTKTINGKTYVKVNGQWYEQ